MRVGVIGCGSIGARHGRNVAILGHDLVLMDTDSARSEALARESCHVNGACGVAYAMRAEPDGRLGLIDLCEAVLICTPADTHVAIASELLSAGYSGPLFVEKPLATSLAEARIFETWPHPTTMVGYNLRWQPQARALRLGLVGCGEVRAARFGLVCNMADWPGTRYGEPLIECSHEIDLAIWCGAPIELSHAEIDKDWAKLEFGDSEHRVDLCWSAAAPRYRRAWTIESERFNGSAWFDSPQALGEQMYRDELVHFLSCAQAGIATECPFADGLVVLRICDLAKTMAAIPNIRR